MTVDDGAKKNIRGFSDSNLFPVIFSDNTADDQACDKLAVKEE
jgi:hypothetical protein